MLSKLRQLKKAYKEFKDADNVRVDVPEADSVEPFMSEEDVDTLVEENGGIPTVQCADCGNSYTIRNNACTECGCTDIRR